MGAKEAAVSEWNPTRERSRSGRLLVPVAGALLIRAVSWFFGRRRGGGVPPEGGPPPGVDAPRWRRGELTEEQAIALADRAVHEVREEMGRGREPGYHEPQPSPEDVRRRREERRRREAEETRR